MGKRVMLLSSPTQILLQDDSRGGSTAGVETRQICSSCIAAARSASHPQSAEERNSRSG